MKFAQYLRDTQTPEWKKAYIDYRGLKKRITAIRKSQQSLSFYALSSDDSPDEDNSPPAAPRPSDLDLHELERSIDLATRSVEEIPSTKSGKEAHGTSAPLSVEGESEIERSKSVSPSSTNGFKDQRSARGNTSFATPSFKATRDKTLLSRMNSFGGSPRHAHPLAALPLHELLTQLSPYEVSFFILLDAQLDKVESFYLAREKEMLARGHTLRIQLNELNDHRKLFHESHTKEPWTAAFASKIRNTIGLYPPIQLEPAHHGAEAQSKALAAASTVTVENDVSHSKAAEDGLPIAGTGTPSSQRSTGKQRHLEEEGGQDLSTDESGQEERTQPHNIPLSADPDSYLYAKRKLKKAVLEHYRGLEVLHNYRILNITGFRKALKKFEKVTKIPVQQQYMTEKVEKSAFASDKAVRQMMSQMEEMYAAAFVHGDKKRAMKRLRAGSGTKSHHFSTFRSGALIGLAIPALIDGLVKVLQPHTRAALPRWDVLLYIYGLILVPVLFSFLVGLNLIVWANARINYAFIFELDVISQLDYREYFETPSLLLSTLCYAFWLSFSLIGGPGVSPTIWPLVWLAFTCVVILDPFPVLFRSSRYWLIKNVARLLVSGTRHVEFTDFWMGDQFCSLVFTLSNIYFFVCVYVDNFSDNWEKCSVTSDHWPIAFVLGSLPLFIRLVQSVKRYNDSKLITHLINGGKYGSGIISYLFFFMWRHHQTNHGSIFALWCLFAVCYSMYSLLWDLLMDWSVLKLHTEHPLLRPELVYTDHISMYYFAIITNILLRFIWVIYIPKSGPNMMVRTFIGGFLEMLRRWQWNFYRLENEHLGNMDQYRVTREVPLPYALEERNGEYEKDDDDDHLTAKR